MKELSVLGLQNCPFYLPSDFIRYFGHTTNTLVRIESNVYPTPTLLARSIRV